MKHVIAVTVTMFLMSGIVAAQEAFQPPPYLFVFEGEVEKDLSGPWTASVVALVDAHDHHDEGMNWAAFREITGGPAVRISFFRGFSKLADLDSWTSNRQILVDVLGPTKGGAVRNALAVGMESSDRVMASVDDLSRPGPANTDPPRFLWVKTVKVAQGKMTEYAALAKRVRRAFDSHAASMHWLCYANAIGGDESELVYFYGFDSFSEVDTWTSRRTVLSAAIGEREGGRLAAALEAITETTTSLWKLEPELSRLGSD